MPLTETQPGSSKSRPRLTMQTAYVLLAFLVVVIHSGTLGDIARGAVSNDGLCTYTFRDVCVSQRMQDVMELKAVVNSLQAQLTLVNKVVAAIPDLRKALKHLNEKFDKKTDRIGKIVAHAVAKPKNHRTGCV